MIAECPNCHQTISVEKYGILKCPKCGSLVFIGDPLKNEENIIVEQSSEEEREERKQSRVRLAFGAGNLFGIVAGAVVILVMLTLIFSIVHFMINDIGRSFSLFQTNF